MALQAIRLALHCYTIRILRSEDQECRLKATAFFRAFHPAIATGPEKRQIRKVGDGIRLLLVDNDDCFIHTLANYARQTGADVSTYRSNVALEMIDRSRPDIVLISPGPARPADFGVPALVQEIARRGIPIFGVCLGLQGIVEAFGGSLNVLGYPMHGKGSLVTHSGRGVFHNLPSPSGWAAITRCSRIGKHFLLASRSPLNQTMA